MLEWCAIAFSTIYLWAHAKGFCRIKSKKLNLQVKEREHLKFHATAAAAEFLQSCPTLCDPIGSSPPGSAVPGIL